jgi:hypothetical protein
MDAARFDRLTVTVARRGTRRSAVALLSAVGLTGLVRQEAAAQCLLNGERCDPKASPNGCCSGKCSRKRKKCRPVPDQGTCTVEQNNCGIGSTACNGDVNCACYITSRGWSVCGTNGQCASPACQRDDDCKRVTGKGSRCVPCPATCGTGTLCVQRCPPA